MKQSAIAVVVCAAGSAVGAIATFDEFPEGQIGETFFSGGIKFFDARDSNNKQIACCADDVSVILPSFGLGEHFSSPNILTFELFAGGADGWGMGGVSQLFMTRGSLDTSARMDVFFLDSDFFAETVVSLEALLDDAVVASDDFIIEGQIPSEPTWRELAIEGATFDTLRLRVSGKSEWFFGSLDNVEIVPSPGAVWVGAFASGAFLRRLRN